LYPSKKALLKYEHHLVTLDVSTIQYVHRGQRDVSIVYVKEAGHSQYSMTNQIY